MNGGIVGVTERAAPGPRVTNFRPGKSRTHYVGISASNSHLSSMKETALSVLGVNIDLSDLDPSEPANRSSSTRLDETYGSCLSTVFNINPNVPKPELPHKDEGMQYINYFFIISHPYLPILHRPTFIRMVSLRNAECCLMCGTLLTVALPSRLSASIPTNPSSPQPRRLQCYTWFSPSFTSKTP